MGVEGKMPMTRYVEVTSSAAAKLLNVYPRKGCIAEGSDADIVIWNTNTINTITHKTHHQAADFNIFEGVKVSGAAEFVVCGGKIVVAEYQVNTSPGSGQYVEASTFPAACYDKIQEMDRKDKPKAVVRADIPTDGSHYYNKCWAHAASFVTSPPLREDQSTMEEMVEAVMDGGLDIVGSGHCTYDLGTRAQGQTEFTAIPQGVNGVEERMGVVYERSVVEAKMPMTRYVEVTSSAAAKLLNVYPRKGCIAEGSDADIVIWNTNTI